MEEKAALSKGACDGQVFGTERRPPPGALTRGMRVCAMKDATPYTNFDSSFFKCVLP
jgi:hypothetical protein